MSTKIEWTGQGGQTWNPWWGCGNIARECDHCYAANLATTFANRRMHTHFAGVARQGEWTGQLAQASEASWQAPLRWVRPIKVFTCSMSDFWHEAVPLDWLARALDVIEQTPHLTYLILSKRPGNAKRKLAALGRSLPDNVWVGATIGHAQSLPLLKPLRAIPAAKHFLSCEPLLTPLVPGLDLAGIDWVITGGESGRHARPIDADWVRAIRDLCIRSGTAFFHKQWGTWAANPAPHEELEPESKKGGATLDGRLWRDFP